MIWKDPPPVPKRSRNRWKNIAEELAKSPNRWALVEVSLTNKAASAGQQALVKWGCEARSVPLRDADGKRTGYYELYARALETISDDDSEHDLNR